MLQLVLTVGAATTVASMGSFEVGGYVPPRCYSGSVIVSEAGEPKLHGTSCTVSVVSKAKAASDDSEIVSVTFTPR
jgi:hypothetical protein